ncbi:MAG: RNA pseudouridine synthase [Erythrobacter sp.]|uniref:RluA family pseudouridine synthase n=1 Tax=Erythrobacter sp. TaxID=1042 RepID=UPI00260B9489|nr:RNA pseudouridine synthase [Erythrobacter sp.]MDJ0978273.1 RNA pseudouridine synthase [Erythrobacter sp.]
MDIPILFEDGEALVIDKPAGLPIDRPRKGGECLEDHLDALKLGFQRLPVPVHRLDTDTSGCLLLARNPKALKRFNKAFEERRVTKTYLAVLAGHPPGTSGTIRLKLAKISSEAKGWRMIAARKGKEAVSHWELVQKLGAHSVIRFTPETGRTHQLRIHAHKGLGAPLLGDPIYGSEDQRGKGAARTLLHASGLVMPRDGKPDIEARAPLPPDFVALGVVEAEAENGAEAGAGAENG